MSGDLLAALIEHRARDRMGLKNDFTFQHRLCHDLESLIWVVIYAMMVRRRKLLADTDQNQSELFQVVLNLCWGVHSYTHLWCNHNNMIGAGCSVRYKTVETLWFTEQLEAAFFRAAMRLVRGQAHDGEAITYESLCALLEKYIQLATEAKDFAVTSK